MKAGLFLIVSFIVFPLAIFAQGPHHLNYQISDSLICNGDSAFIGLTGCSGAHITPASFVYWQDSIHAVLYPDTTITYTLTGIDNGQQHDTSYVTISVSTLRINITAGSIACYNGQATVTVNGAGGMPPYNGNGIYAAPAGTHHYGISDAQGCTAVDSVVITQPSIISPNETVGSIHCFGDSAPVTINATGGVPPYTGTGVHYVRAGNYSFTISDANGCSTTLSANLTQPTPVFMQVIANPIHCYGDSALVTISAFGGTPQYTGTGNFNVGPGNHYFVVTDLDGCSAADSITVTEPAPIAVNIVADTDRICASDTVSICATTGFATYFWNSGDTGTCIYVQQAGNYYVTATDKNNCSVESNHVRVTVFTSPSVSVNISGDTLRAYNADSYQWYMDEQPIPGATSSQYIGHVGHEYQVLVSDSDGCSAFSSPLGVIGGFSNLTDDILKVYPNPFGSDGFGVNADGELSGANLQILDADGKLVYVSTIVPAFTNIQLNSAAGVYWLKITSVKGNFVKRMVKL